MALYREMDRTLAPFDRNSLRWELLDAAHGASAQETIDTFRGVVTQCDEGAATASDPEEAARWRSEAERPLRLAAVLAEAEDFRVRWKLPGDAAADLLDAYLSREERLAPASGAPAEEAAEPLIDLRPAVAALDWLLSYERGLGGAGDADVALDEYLDRMFASLRAEAHRRAREIDLRLDERNAVTTESISPARANAVLLYAWLHEPSRLGPNQDARETQQKPPHIQALLAQLGIAEA
jgi:hypothetical protein